MTELEAKQQTDPGDCAVVPLGIAHAVLCEPGFLRMVPGEAERDKVIFIKSSRGEYLGSRLSRIQPNEIYLQINKAGATSDVMIPFTEIMEIQVRQKDPAAAPSH